MEIIFYNKHKMKKEILIICHNLQLKKDKKNIVLKVKVEKIALIARS